MARRGKAGQGKAGQGKANVLKGKMNKQIIIGFGNKARHGKDTAAEAIVSYFDRKTAVQVKHSLPPAGPTVKIYKYATALYQEVNDWLKYQADNIGDPFGSRVVFDINNKETQQYTRLPEWVQPDPNPEVNALAPYGKHPKLLQYWGTEYRRNQDKNYWINRLFDQIKKDNIGIALVTDVRFKNEAFEIENRGGYTVNVTRLNADGSKFVDPNRPADHPSEVDLDDWNWNFRLVNSHGHQALLAEQAVTLIEYLRAF